MPETRKKLRVGFVSYDYRPAIGGQGVYVSEIVDRLPEYGIEPEVICASSLEPGAIAIAGKNSIIYSARLAMKLGSIVKERGYDLLHVQGGPGGALLLRRPSVPLVYTAHHTYSQQRRLITHPLWKSVPYKLLERMEIRGYRMASHVVSVSTSTEAVIQGEYGVPEQRTSVIPNGVDTDRFRNMSIEKHPGSILYVGRLHDRKGINYLVQAVALLKKHMPDVHLFIAGDGPHAAKVRQLVRSLDIDSSVTFLGRVSDADLPTWYNRAEVFVLPSLFEGFGIVCIEAMACETPVVATEVPGTLDVVDNGSNGYLVPSKDPSALAGALERLLADPVLRRRMGELARKKVEERFTWASVAEQIGSLYRQIA